MKLRLLSSAPVENQRVLLRTDFNVPMQNGVIQDDTRLRESLPTLRYLLKGGAKIIVMSHLGRPKGVEEALRMDGVAQALSALLKHPVKKLKDCIGPEVEEAVSTMQGGEIILLENLRFHPEETANDPDFAAALARLADLYVSDAFGTVHRAHASTEGVARLLPSYAGLLLEKEVKVLSGLMENPEKPLCLILGGAKMDTKIGVLEKFLPIADAFIIGGALANTFLKAQGYDVGASLMEEAQLETARRFLEQAQGKKVLLPVDVLAAKEVSPEASPEIFSVDAVEAPWKILDFGPQSIANCIELLQGMKTVIWNGPVGLYEMESFSKGTRALAEAIARSDAMSVLGGGDTLDAVHHFGIDESAFTHLSTGGGAMLEFLEGKMLPGIEVLLERA